MEPLTLADAKLFCRVDNTVEDSLIQALIVAAREAAESRCNRGMTLEDWPDGYPEQARIWQLVQVATLYDNREAYVDGKVFRLDHVDRLTVCSPGRGLKFI